jgi:KDO2-lipid IV(A) lauroyltransferase
MSLKHLLKGRAPMWVQEALAGVFRGVLSVPLIVPVDRAGEVARAAARAFATSRINRKKFPRALNNLRDAYPDWDEDRVRATAIAAYEHLFQLGVEILYAPRLITEEGFTRHLGLSRITEGARRLIEGGPVVLITGHCGNWELIGYAVSMLGFPMQAVYRPLDLKPLDAWMRDTRQRQGLTLVSKFGAMKTLPPALRAGVPIGLVADQNGGERGVFVPFFGRLTSTYKSIGLLAMQANASIACGMARRLSPGEPDPDAPPGAPNAPASRIPARRGIHATGQASMRYSAEVVDSFGPDDWTQHPDPLFYLTARYRRAMELMIRKAPEQYLWMHRIWRSRPPHERSGKPFPQSLREKLRLLPWMTSEELERLEERSRKDAELVATG